MIRKFKYENEMSTSTMIRIIDELDSLGVVNLCLALERSIENDFGKYFTSFVILSFLSMLNVSPFTMSCHTSQLIVLQKYEFWVIYERSEV